MSYSISEEVELNESKFLSEQVNWDEEPTEEEIIEKAEELGIDDYGLAKEALIKQLDPEWRPYINRHGQVYYINLEEGKGYVDHPIDMFYKISYAIKNKKKIPSFQEYLIEQVSEDPKIILRQIANFRKDQGLRVVYQESEEQSVRKNTKRSQQEQEKHHFDHQQLEQFNLAYENQIKTFRQAMELQFKKELELYKTRQEEQFKVSKERHEVAISRIKAQRLEQIGAEFEKQWQNKNELSLKKSVQGTRAEFQEQKNRLQDMLHRQYQLNEQLCNTKEVKSSYKIMHRSKVIKRKQKLRDEMLRQIGVQFRGKVAEAIQDGKIEHNKEVKYLTDSKINYKQLFNRNLRQLNRQDNQCQKKRYSIFYPETLHSNASKTEPIQLQQLSYSSKVWTDTIVPQDYVCQTKPSLSLRLFKRIL